MNQFIRLTNSSGQALLLALRYVVSIEARRSADRAATTVRVVGSQGVEAYAVLEEFDAIERELLGHDHAT